MLTDAQKAGIRDLCMHLVPDIVKAVADTTTKKTLALTSLDGNLSLHHNCLDSYPLKIDRILKILCTTDAIDAIILHSDSAVSLLNRKKLTRTLLFEYLHSKKFPISGKAEKCDIIVKILEYWDSVQSTTNSTITQIPPSSMEVLRLEDNGLNTYPDGTLRENSTSQAEVLSDQAPVMGIEFAKWFYDILFAVHNKTLPAEQLQSQFWKDAKFCLTFQSQSNCESHQAVGDSEASQLVYQLICQNACLLNPNISQDGVREKRNVHGMVVIGVCGTVHQRENCSGIFEQVFGLLRDPSAEFSWRIKWSNLRVSQALVSQIPCIKNLPELMALCDRLTE